MVPLVAVYNRLETPDPLKARFFALEVLLDLTGPILCLWQRRLSSHSLVPEKDFLWCAQSLLSNSIILLNFMSLQDGT